VRRFPVLRLKGFAAIAGKPKRLLVQVADGRLDSAFDRPWGEGEERRTDLVVIGLKGLDEAAIATVLRG
jgi:cobalamin biosynthesis protein CobW